MNDKRIWVGGPAVRMAERAKKIAQPTRERAARIRAVADRLSRPGADVAERYARMFGRGK